MSVSLFNWETLVPEKSTRGGTRVRSTVKVLSNGKAGKPRAISISSDLVAELGWQDGDRVELCKDRDTNTFGMKRNKVGLMTLKQVGKTLYINGQNNAVLLMPSRNGWEFDAWVSGGMLLFKPRKENK